MARIFISYSRVDLVFTHTLVERLRRIYGHGNVWYDDALHGGDTWWEEILDQIAAADIFLYLLSNESVTSPYCQAELAEALRLQKRIITVQARDRTNLTDTLGDIQYVDMKAGPDDAEAYNRLIASINRQADKVKRHRALWKGRTDRPGKPQPEPDNVDRADITTPDLKVVFPSDVNKPSRRLPESWILIVVGVVLVIGGIIAAIIATGNGDNSPGSSHLTASPLAQISDASTPTDEPLQTQTFTLTPTDEPSVTPSPLSTRTPSETPTIDVVAVATSDAQETLDAQATLDTHTLLNVDATATANSEIRRGGLTATAIIQGTLGAQATLDTLRATNLQRALDNQATRHAPATIAAQGTLDAQATLDVLRATNLQLALDNQATRHARATATTMAQTTQNMRISLPGSFGTLLGCPGDWQPDCNALEMAYDTEDDLWRASLRLPAGEHEVKVAINGTWDENYGLGGVRDGPNIPFSVSTNNTTVIFTYDSRTHLLTIQVD